MKTMIKVLVYLIPVGKKITRKLFHENRKRRDTESLSVSWKTFSGGCCQETSIDLYCKLREA